MYDDAYTRNEDGELAVRTVNVTEGSNSSSYDDVFTRDTEGKLALRVTGGGGDTHNKGYFATLAELQEAYPTGEAGDWAIVAESDTVYIWDDTQQAWVDTDQKGQVTSVNGQTGDVTLTIPDAVQYSTMPTASADNLGKIVQFTGTTDANYTNGYFYQCVSDGQEPATYSWTQVDVQPAPSGLPDQTGQSGKFLTTDGTDASWSDKPLVNMVRTAEYGGIVIGQTSVVNTAGIVIGRRATGTTYTGQIVIGDQSGATKAWGVAIGYNAHSTAEGAIQLSGAGNTYASAATNSESYTLKVCLGVDTDGSKNYKLLDSDGTIPEARLADTTNAAQGQVLTLDSNLNAVWQAGGSGGLQNTETGSNSLGVLSSDGATTYSTVVGKNAMSSSSSTVVVGATARVFGSSANYATIIGVGSYASNSEYGVAVGAGAKIGATHAIQLGGKTAGGYTNSDANTFKVGNVNGNFEMMDANGNLPADRLASTTGLADGNYRLRLVMASGVPTLEWVAE